MLLLASLISWNMLTGHISTLLLRVYKAEKDIFLQWKLIDPSQQHFDQAELKKLKSASLYPIVFIM